MANICTSRSNMLYTLPKTIMLHKKRNAFLKNSNKLEKFVDVYNKLNNTNITIEELNIKTQLQSELLHFLLKMFYNSFLLNKGSFKLTGSQMCKDKEQPRIQYHTGKFYTETNILGKKVKYITTSITGDLCDAFGFHISDYVYSKLIHLLIDLKIITRKLVTKAKKTKTSKTFKDNKIRTRNYFHLTKMGHYLLLHYFGKTNGKWNKTASVFFRLQQKINAMHKQGFTWAQIYKTIRKQTIRHKIRTKYLIKQYKANKHNTHNANVNHTDNALNSKTSFFNSKKVHGSGVKNSYVFYSFPKNKKNITTVQEQTQHGKQHNCYWEQNLAKEEKNNSDINSNNINSSNKNINSINSSNGINSSNNTYKYADEQSINKRNSNKQSIDYFIGDDINDYILRTRNLKVDYIDEVKTTVKKTIILADETPWEEC